MHRNKRRGCQLPTFLKICFYLIPYNFDLQCKAPPFYRREKGDFLPKMIYFTSWLYKARSFALFFKRLLHLEQLSIPFASYQALAPKKLATQKTWLNGRKQRLFGYLF